MSEEKKEGGCCGTHGSAGPCCGVKKLLIFVVIGVLIFIAGMMFGKSCPLSGGNSGMMCPIPAAQK